MVVRESIKLIHAALDEDDKGNIILRGVISPESFYHLKVGPYQREILPQARIKDLMKAFEVGGVPDVELGMRGGNFLEKEGAFFLQNDTYIIDGLQRITAGRMFIEEQKIPRLGGVVHFNTTEDWERNRFRILNTMGVKLSPNVLIRNMEKELEVVAMLRTLSKDRGFVLNDKICWNQRMTRSELVSARTFLFSAGFLHSKFGPTRGGRLSEMAENMQEMYAKLGRSIMRENIRKFWDLMDECFKLRYVTFKEGAIYLKTGFIFMMAMIMSEYANFWDDCELSVDKDLRKKISQFPINDPEVIRLSATSSGTATDMLTQLMVKHINRGKTTRRLVPNRKSFKITPHGQRFSDLKKVV